MRIIVAKPLAVFYSFFSRLLMGFFLCSTAVASQSSMVELEEVTASSQYPRDRSSYYPSHAVDGKNSTAWFPARNSDGNKGEWIKFAFKRKTMVGGINIVNGWAKNDRLFYHNSRIKSAFLEFSDGSRKKINLKDTKSKQYVGIEDVETDYVKIIIDEVYPGQTWNHEAGITEVSFEIADKKSKHERNRYLINRAIFDSIKEHFNYSTTLGGEEKVHISTSMDNCTLSQKVKVTSKESGVTKVTTVLSEVDLKKVHDSDNMLGISIYGNSGAFNLVPIGKEKGAVREVRKAVITYCPSRYRCRDLKRDHEYREVVSKDTFYLHMKAVNGSYSRGVKDSMMGIVKSCNSLLTRNSD